MMVRQDFSELPPKMFMMQIMDDVMKAYCFLWDRKNRDNKIVVTWKDLSRYFNKNNFRSSLRKLNNQGLINYDECEEGIQIEVVAWDECMNEK